MRLPKLIVILGPTASGKSALAIELARRFNGEIINADSRQIYEGMPVGTASSVPSQKSKVKSQKLENRRFYSGSPEPKTRGRWFNSKFKSFFPVDGVPHHLFHCVKPDTYFSVADYKKLAVKKIRDIARCGKVPFLVGGTGLYIWTVVDNLDIPAVPPHAGLRRKLELRPRQELYDELKQKDPEAAVLTGFNKRRIIRALEVIEATGKPFSKQRLTGKPLFDVLQIGLKVPLAELDKKIEARAHEMLEHGFLDEVKTLLKNYPPNLPAFSALGYRHFIQHLKGELSLEAATDHFIRSHKRLARRQLRWFKRDTRIHWFSPKNKAAIERTVETFLSA